MSDTVTYNKEILALLEENDRRNAEIYAPFNPITGENSVLFKERVKVEIGDFPIPIQYLPGPMLDSPLVKKLIKAGGVDRFIEWELFETPDSVSRQKVIEEFVKVRDLHDFAFWAASFAYIKPKGGGEDILFRLNRPQRRLVERLERLRLAGKPIRIILLKARQWGGSTCIQLYMAWLQLVHKVGLNSLIVAHQNTASDEIQDMFDRMIKAYPISLLHSIGEAYSLNEPKFIGVGKSGNTHRVPQRNCKIKIGTAVSPDSARGGDYNLVHCSEVGLWKKTDGKTPQQIVRSACSGVLLEPLTMIIYESTPNGVGNFFHREYVAAKAGRSQFEAMFTAWFDIPQYSLCFADENEKYAFARGLYVNRANGNINSDREESGQYQWWLWEKGATLEAIHWYVKERAKYDCHADMASEYPSDDIEAFANSGANVFNRYNVEKLRTSCKCPRYIGDVYGFGDEGEDALKDLKFREDSQGQLWVWSLPEIDMEEKITDRYVTIVDVGGRTKGSDWSVILVIDRLFQMEGGKPSVVAQWYGHIDMDLLAWKAAQIAAFYDNSLLVIESNTPETRDIERRDKIDGDQSAYILNQIKEVYSNLYERKQNDAEIIEGAPRKYGFHVNRLTKPMIISTLIKVTRESLYTERDERCLDEYLEYEKKQNGSYGARAGCHDDLLMTRAIGLHVCLYEMDLPRVVRRSTSLRPRTRRIVSAATIG